MHLGLPANKLGKRRLDLIAISTVARTNGTLDEGSGEHLAWSKRTLAYLHPDMKGVQR